MIVELVYSGCGTHLSLLNTNQLKCKHGLLLSCSDFRDWPIKRSTIIIVKPFCVCVCVCVLVNDFSINLSIKATMPRRQLLTKLCVNIQQMERHLSGNKVAGGQDTKDKESRPKCQYDKNMNNHLNNHLQLTPVESLTYLSY